jgi:hypothetical protein
MFLNFMFETYCTYVLQNIIKFITVLLFVNVICPKSKVQKLNFLLALSLPLPLPICEWQIQRNGKTRISRTTPKYTSFSFCLFGHRLEFFFIPTFFLSKSTHVNVRTVFFWSDEFFLFVLFLVWATYLGEKMANRTDNRK